ncbi:MAG: serine/threonine protein kinase [Anaeromyxobacter sp.]|nr:serine/threonine protein kinase [Anaeromyxobacter sp.]MBL0276039.1 serine/threonine protein kinase [Anaeromyxobacter sp.]
MSAASAVAALDDHLVLKGLIGRGAMGEVHRAWDAALERAVAVKFLRGFDAREAERVLLEARLQARVEHPHVVRVLEVGTLGGRPCLVLQLVEGPSLADFGPGCTLVERVELVRQAAEGLHAAHREGLVHRDVKPDNVLVDLGGPAPRALVSDFGLARGDEGGLTRSGLPAGTVEYMSPEHVLGASPADYRADIYALGAALYALLAGRPPFRRASEPGGASDETSLLRRILEDAPDPLPPAVPVELRRVVAKAMEKAPEARYASALAFAEDLGRFQRGEPVRARPAPAVERLYRWARRNRAASRALAVALATLLAALGSALWLSRRSGIDSLEAARLGALATSLETRLRLEWLAPPHDLRPALAALRPEVERLRPLAAGGRSAGPASYALGKGLELLDDLDGARAAYQRALALGFEGPEVAEGLGEVMGRLYERERDRALRTLGPAARGERLASLQRELRDPALRSLAQGAGGGWRLPWLRARMALLEGDLDAARARAAEALAAAPERYEARVLQGEAWMAEAERRSDAEQLAEGLAALEQGEAALTAAAEWGRSDPRLLRLLARLHVRRAEFTGRQGKETGALVEAAQGWLDRAARLDPDAPALLIAQAALLMDSERLAANFGRFTGLPRLERAAALLRQAVALRPEDVEARSLLMVALQRVGHFLLERGLPCLEPLDEGIAMLGATVALAPSDPEVRDTGATLLAKKGRWQVEAGLDARATLQAAVQEAEAALRLDPPAPARVQQTLAEALVFLGQASWLSGVDPRPAFERAIAVTEAVTRAEGENFLSTFRTVYILATASMTLLDMGADARPDLARALEAATRARATHPEQPLLGFLHGQVLTIEARRALLDGQDPMPAVGEARRLLTEAVLRMGNPAVAAETRTMLSLLEGRWRVTRGLDPGAALAEAERGFARLEVEVKGTMAGPIGRAACALERARWLRRQGGDAAAAARRGLAPVEEAIRRGGLDPTPRVVQARLLGFTGDVDGGRAALARTLAGNALVGGGAEARLAAAELGVP